MNITGHDTADLFSVQRRIAKTLGSRLDTALEAAFLYHRHAPAYEIRWTWALAQSFLEADWTRSIVCRERHNYAGIKHQDGSGYRTYPNPTLGIIDHLELLAVYTGLWIPVMTDPTRNTRIPEILEQRLGRPYAIDSTDLNGIWAVPGTEYGENIDRVNQHLLGWI